MKVCAWFILGSCFTAVGIATGRKDTNPGEFAISLAVNAALMTMAICELKGAW